MLFYHVIKIQNGDIVKRNIGYQAAIAYCNLHDLDGSYGEVSPAMRKGNKFIVWSPSAGREV